MDYELLEEELEIIEVFDYEMALYGHKGYYSINDKIDNGYSIYKDNRNWVLDFNEKGKTTSTRRYTNIFNLCEDVLSILKIDDFYFRKRDLTIPRGTRVIITKSTDCPIDELNQGVIINSRISRNNRGQAERLYEVASSDGKIYEGLYGLKIYGDICFRTMEDYINDMEKEISENRETIKELVDRNWELYFMMQEIKGEKERYLDEGMHRK